MWCWVKVMFLKNIEITDCGNSASITLYNISSTTAIRQSWSAQDLTYAPCSVFWLQWRNDFILSKIHGMVLRKEDIVGSSRKIFFVNFTIFTTSWNVKLAWFLHMLLKVLVMSCLWKKKAFLTADFGIRWIFQLERIKLVVHCNFHFPLNILINWWPLIMLYSPRHQTGSLEGLE